MARDIDRDDTRAEGEEMIREGDLVVEERMNRREGLVEYAGTVEATGTAAEDETVLDDAMQAGAAVLGGTGSTAMVDDAASMSGGTTATGGAGSGSAYPADPLSMATDNTPEGRIMGDTVEGGPISQVREGMKVVDAAGEDVGKVEFVKMGDPSAATTEGEAVAESGLGERIGDTLLGDEPRLPEPMRAELLRLGFIRVDARGWFTGHRYVGADQIAGVGGDTVTLNVGKDALPKE